MSLSSVSEFFPAELEAEIAYETAYGPPPTEQLADSLENIFYASLSPFSDIQSEGLSALAELTLHETVKEMCTTRVEQVESLVPLLRSMYPIVTRCASSVIVNLLESKNELHRSAFYTVLMEAGCVEALHDLMVTLPDSSTSFQVHECKKALFLLSQIGVQQKSKA